MSRSLLILTLTLVSIGLNACGYSTSSRFDGGRERAARLTFGMARNQISPPRPGLEYAFTERLKSEFARDGRYELALSAPASLEITLTDFRERALVRDFDDRQREIALNIEARIRVLRDGKELRRGDISAWTSYAPAINESRDEGFDRLWRELAREALDFLDNGDWLEAAAGDANKSQEAAESGAKG
ncbi:MAG: hypothetical protein KDB07_01010 [Planctomycetes bacterium]|nr:hypothetical protein [Planctomycetota bacterium]